MSKIPAINEIDANSPSQESKEVVVKATDVSPDINEIQETISASATIQEVDNTRKPTISEIYKIVTDGLFESTSNWWDYAYKLSQAQINQDIMARLDKGEIGGGYSKGIDIITTTKYAVPTNANVYSALKSDSLYPKKLNDEKINGIYDFLNGITIGNPTAYTGATWSVNQDGKTSLTTDYLYVRLKAIFETLQILNVETIGGKMVISPAGSIKIVYVDEITTTFEGIEQKAYRCYFLGEQEGEEIDNKWKVYDQAQAKSFNVKKGIYHKIGNHYLWRLVIGVSKDTVTIDDKKYHYVDLSQLVFDAGSDAPAPGDVLNQFGYRGTDDAQRQSALIFSAVDGNAPSITLYSGVNSFNLLNKEYVSFGVVNGKAFFKLYGDTYIGDRGENPNTYIKYHNGQLDIKANLDISSSIGGSSFEDYIKENAPGVDESQVINIINNSQVIKDLQKQTDGAIETWFYEGEPTLDNLPAVDWTNTETKDIHVGDLYYDQISGYAYRFTKYNDEVNPYSWNRIKDNDIVTALEAANKAQYTADHKMKVFYGEEHPTDYQAGDMWVNAVLSGKFNNDIARATTTNKTFNADDWVLASRYSAEIEALLKWSNTYETKFANLTEEVKKQKDQSIIVWYYEYAPAIDNAPANEWNTDELRTEHIGDIFYDIKNNHSYRWSGSTWIEIKDANFDEAMKAAKDAGDLADSKRRVFYSSTTPTEPFDEGDLWLKQVNGKNETWVYNGTKWVKSNDKDLADFTDAVNKELAGIQAQLDGKAETWYQDTDPSTNWTTQDKANHEGDIWYNTTDGTTQYWNATTWEKMDIPKDVFDTIDGKSSIYVDSYADAKAGKGVISKGYDERDIWILPSDAVVNSTQYYKGDILTATANSSTFNEKHWVKKVRYVGEKELNSAVSVVQKQIDTINNTTLPNINKQFNDFVKDGILTTSEKARLKEALAALTSDKSKLLDSVAEVEKSEYLKNDTLVIPDLKTYVTALTNSFTEYESFVKTLIADSKTNITKTELATYQNNYTNLVNAINNVRYQITMCQSQIYKNIGADITTYKYLKEAIKGHTQINGGLVFTNVIQLRKTADVNSQVTAGISGLQAKTDANGNIIAGSEDLSSIAAWYGGPMVDRVTIDGVPSTWNEDTIKTDIGKKYAASIFRHDGSGYLAGGRIWWDRETGELHVNANSFIVNKDDLGLLATLFRLNLGTKYNIISAQPTAPFTNLTVLGSKTLNGITIGTPTSGGRIVIGNIVISNSGASDIVEISNLDGTKVANLGVSGGVSAYGTYTSSSSGGSLNGSVKAYADAIRLTTENLSEVASAYSVAKLKSLIDEIDGSALTEVDWSIIKNKPTTLAGYNITDGINSVSVNGSGNAVTSASISNHSLTLTKGATFLTSHQTLDHIISIDKRNTVLSPTSYIKGIYPVFMYNTTDGLSDGGTCHGILHWRSYGHEDDLTGGYPIQIAYTATGRLWTRIATSSTTWGDWKKIARTEDIPKTYAGSSSAGGDATRTLKLKDYNGDYYDIYCGYSGNSLNAGEITAIVGTKPNGSKLYYKDVQKSTLQAWLGLGARAYDNTSYLPLSGGTMSGIIKRSSGGLTIRGRDNAIIRQTYAPGSSSWNPIACVDTETGTWTLGHLSTGDSNTEFHFCFSTDADYDAGNNSGNYVSLRNISGTIALISDIPTKVSSLSNDSGYITSSGSCSYATSAGNADKVDGVHVTWAGALTSTSHLVAWEADGSALRDLNPVHLKLSQFTDDILSGKYLPLGGGTITGSLKVNNYIFAYRYGVNDNAPAIVFDKPGDYYTGIGTCGVSNTIHFGAVKVDDMTWQNDFKQIWEFNGRISQPANSYLYLGRADNSGRIYCQDIASEAGSQIWAIHRNSGNAEFSGTVTTGNLLSKGGVTAYSSSDIRLKKNLCKLNYLSIIKAMGGSYGFTWRKDNKRSIGWIAQHVLSNPYMKDIVETDKDGYYKINYWSPKLIATAFGAIEQVDDEVTKLKTRVAYLERELERLTNDNKLFMNK